MENHYMFKFYVEKPNGEVEFISQVFRTEGQMNKTMKRAILSAYGWATLLYTVVPKKIIVNQVDEEYGEHPYISYTSEQIDEELVGHEPTMTDIERWTSK